MYLRGRNDSPEFVEGHEPTHEAQQVVLHKIITRLMKLGAREEQSQIYMADDDGDSEEARVQRPMQAAACTYRVASAPVPGGRY